MCFLIGIVVLTEPEIGPSCADLPLTLNVTPFGAFDLTSRFAGGLLEGVLEEGGCTNLLVCGRSPCSEAAHWISCEIPDSGFGCAYVVRWLSDIAEGDWNAGHLEV
jgi:hypothetical protein